jgi:hypothetical protein
MAQNVESHAAPKVLMTVREAYAIASDEVIELSERGGDPAVVLSNLAVHVRSLRER